jgi:transcriptional regulator with XRE-family HTH domain
MSRIRVDDLHKSWMKNSKYRREYDALEEEFSLVAALIEARSRAGLTQEEVAHRMKTTQAVIARLEGGGSKPSTRTLERYAEATHSRLRITFEPEVVADSRADTARPPSAGSFHKASSGRSLALNSRARRKRTSSA